VRCFDFALEPADVCVRLLVGARVGEFLLEGCYTLLGFIDLFDQTFEFDLLGPGELPRSFAL
jgi:hypothetical protein